MVGSRENKLQDQAVQSSQKLREYAYQVITEQFKYITKQEKKVLEDRDPEPLHQMRVASRRLRTALQVFGVAIVLPKEASGKQLRDIARVLGGVRDLDVQIASLKHDYQPNIKKREQQCIDKVIDSLKKQRKKAFVRIEKTFEKSLYQDLKSAFSSWLKHPQYTSIAQLPLTSLLPDLLSPLLSHLLLHPGWLISVDEATGKNASMLHELRKALKHARYQTEFFVPCYGDTFQNWVKEVKELQDRLGQFQDIQVLQALLNEELDEHDRLPDLQTMLNTKISEGLSTWEETRQKYLDTAYRYDLHQMLLQPKSRTPYLEAELVKN